MMRFKLAECTSVPDHSLMPDKTSINRESPEFVYFGFPPRQYDELCTLSLDIHQQPEKNYLAETITIALGIIRNENPFAKSRSTIHTIKNFNRQGLPNALEDVVAEFSRGVVSKLASCATLSALTTVWNRSEQCLFNIDVIFGHLISAFTVFRRIATLHRAKCTSIMRFLICRIEETSEMPAFAKKLALMLGVYDSIYVPELVKTVSDRSFALLNDMEPSIGQFFKQAFYVIERESEILKEAIDQSELKNELMHRIIEPEVEKIEKQMESDIACHNFPLFDTLIQSGEQCEMMQIVMEVLIRIIRRLVTKALNSENVIFSLIALVESIRSRCSMLSPTRLQILQNVFQDSLNNNPKHTAVVIAYDADRIITENKVFNTDEFAKLIFLIEDKQTFRNTYKTLLVVRSMKSRYIPFIDQHVLDSIERLEGNKDTLIYRGIIDSVMESKSLMDSFPRKLPFRMNCILIPQNAFRTPRFLKMKLKHIKEPIQEVLAYMQSYFTGRKLELNFEMSTAVLTRNGFRIKCPAIYAIPLLLFNQCVRSYNTRSLAKKLEIEDESMEVILNALASKKCGRILHRTRKSYYKLNKLSKSVQIPMTIIEDDNRSLDNVQEEQNRMLQIDCTMMTMIKAVRSIHIAELKQVVEQRVGWPITDETFKARLSSLEKRFLVEIESSNVLYRHM